MRPFFILLYLEPHKIFDLDPDPLENQADPQHCSFLHSLTNTFQAFQDKEKNCFASLLLNIIVPVCICLTSHEHCKN